MDVASVHCHLTTLVKRKLEHASSAEEDTNRRMAKFWRFIGKSRLEKRLTLAPPDAMSATSPRLECARARQKAPERAKSTPFAFRVPVPAIGLLLTSL